MFSRFSDETCEALYLLSLDGGPDDQYGNCAEAPCRWWGLLLNVGSEEMIAAGMDADALGPDYPLSAIITEDSQGFVDYETFPNAEEARQVFDRIVSEVEAELEEVNA